MPSGFAGIADDAPAASPPTPPRGWYPDAADPGQWRFWTGSVWTAHRHARNPADAAQYAPEGSARSASTPLTNDLRNRIPAQSVIEKLIELERTGFRAEQHSWHSGAIGERYVADLLARLGTEWTVLHSVPVGSDGSDIDHVLIGPPGVFTINTKHHPGARVWVAGRGLRVNNHPQHYLSNAEHEAARAERLLSKASGLTVEVVGIIVIVGASVTVRERPHSDTAQIGVIPASALLQTVQVRRAYSDEQLASIVAAAVRAETWSALPPRHAADPAALLEEFSRIDARIRAEGGRTRTPIARRAAFGPEGAFAAPAPTSTTRPARPRTRGFRATLLRLLGVAAIGLGVWWGLTTVLPLVLQHFVASSQARITERAELATLTSSAEAVASALDQMTAGGPPPATLQISPGAALLTTDTGVLIADLPDGTTGTYAVSADGLSYSLTLVAPGSGASVTVTPELGVVATEQ